MTSEPATADQAVEDVLGVFSEIAKLDSQVLRGRLKRLDLHRIDEPREKDSEDPQLVSACQKFLVNVCEEIASRYCTVSELAARRQQAPTPAPDAEDAKLEVKRLEKAVCRVADVCFAELSEHFQVILKAL